MSDSVIDEVRAIRSQIAEECGFDLGRILQHAEEVASKIKGMKYVTLEEMKRRHSQSTAARQEYERQERSK